MLYAFKTVASRRSAEIPHAGWGPGRGRRGRTVCRRHAAACVRPWAWGRARTHHDDHHDGDDALEERAREAYRLRVEAARFQRHQPQPSQRSNGDERRYSNFIGNFSKSLPHDAFGIVDPAAYNALRHAMKTRRSGRLRRDSEGRRRKAVQPSIRLRVSDGWRRLSPSGRPRAAGPGQRGRSRRDGRGVLAGADAGRAVCQLRHRPHHRGGGGRPVDVFRFPRTEDGRSRDAGDDLPGDDARRSHRSLHLAVSAETGSIRTVQRRPENQGRRRRRRLHVGLRVVAECPERRGGAPVRHHRCHRRPLHQRQQGAVGLPAR